MNKLLLALIVVLAASPVFANDSLINREDTRAKVFFEIELGAIAVHHHTLRIGDKDTADTFNYVTQGGQDILYPFQRWEAGLELGGKHNIFLTYQPLEIVTETVFDEERVIDGVAFTAGTPMEVSYAFPFYRATYGYDFFESPTVDLGLGAAMQIRNASIVFKQLDGDNKQMVVSQNIGPVPALYFFGRYEFDNGFFLASDITGLYASSAIINGAEYDFEGSILDASLKGGYALKNDMEVFFNVRFFGGSAAGTSSGEDLTWTDSENPETANYLATTTYTIGVAVR